MEENQTQPEMGSFNTSAVWDLKSILLNQYAIAYNNLADYVVEPNKTINKINAKKSVLKLMYPLYPKIYVLGRNFAKKRDYIAYFMCHPDKMDLMECQAAFLILQRVMENLGLTRFEKYQLNITEIYNEQ